RNFQPIFLYLTLSGFKTLTEFLSFLNLNNENVLFGVFYLPIGEKKDNFPIVPSQFLRESSARRTPLFLGKVLCFF
ncbi:MAG: hypothetical protein ACI85I_002002, partial [Arenicella sp.]